MFGSIVSIFLSRSILIKVIYCANKLPFIKTVKNMYMNKNPAFSKILIYVKVNAGKTTFFKHNRNNGLLNEYLQLSQ
jgi:hypothetical protein